jgi:glycosidase
MSRNFGCTKVTLVMHKDGEDNVYRNMFWCGMNGDNEEWWDITFAIESEGLYFYHFTYETPFGTGNIFLRSAGIGEFAPQGKEWQQTVYKKDFTTPDWVKGGIMYQIFPDRFNIGKNPPKSYPSDRILHSSTEESPVWEPDSQGKILNNDYYGGTLKGIEEKLSYIKSLGVNILYLNPIFEAHSNHRYNTANYEKIDPMLGTEADFRSLCHKANTYGIKIILDGVFSHTGSDSIYFNREGRYENEGFIDNPDGKYKDWFTTEPDGKYKSWWGIDTLPETNEESDSFIEYINGNNGIVQKWLKAGAYGFRLDVADELPDKFIDALSKSVKSQNKDYLIIGEVWEDATNKISHGGRRRYLTGDQLDSVMNYPLRNGIIDFVTCGSAEMLYNVLIELYSSYPRCVCDSLMNILGTHDTERILTVLGDNYRPDAPNDHLAVMRMTPHEKEKAIARLKLASILQYTVYGIPSVYYGDEAGVEGYHDPFCRRTYPWGREEKKLIDHYKRLGELRNIEKAFDRGDFRVLDHGETTLVFERSKEDSRVVVIANGGNENYKVKLDGKWIDMLSYESYENFISTKPHTARIMKRI